MTSTRIAFAIALVAACGGKNNGNPDSNGGGQHDAMIDTPVVPATIMITGTATAPTLAGTSPVSGATIGAYQSSNPNTAITTAMTDAQGNFTLTLMTNGAALDGFLKATNTGYVDTYVYPPAPVVMNDMNVPVEMLTSGNNGTFNLLSTIAQGNQQPGNGLIAVLVHDASMMPVMGATISSTPASNPYRYNAGNPPRPNSTATSTAADGIGYMFNASPTGTVMVTASKTGATFKTHSVTAWPDSLTTTEITE